MKTQGAKVGSVFLEVTANSDNFKRVMAETDAQTKRTAASMREAMAKSTAETKRFGEQMRTTMNRSAVETRGLTGSLHGLHGVLATVGFLAAGHQLKDMADTFSLMRSRIRLVTQAGEDMYKIEEQLTQQAMTNRASLQETITLYTRLRQARADLGDAQVQNLVDKWSKTLIISAASSQEAASSTQQFAQAMSAGVLSGQELRSVIQGNSAFAVSLAKGLGVTTGALKQMGEEGKLTTEAIFAAIDKAGGSIEHDFAKKALTVHQALTNVETATIRLVGVTDQAFGISGGLATWVNALSGALGDLTLMMQGPIEQAEDALAKMRKANQAVADDIPHLLTLHENLEAAIRSQGTAAEETARLELNALTTRIAKNKELAATYRLIMQAKLAEAEKQVRERDQYLDGAFTNDVTRRQQLDMLMKRIATKQAGDIPLNGGEIRTLQDEARFAQLRADVIALRKTIGDIDKGVGTLPAPVDTGGSGTSKPGILEDLANKQLQLELARARNQTDRVAKLEDEIAILQLTATLTEKGLNAEQAKARAAGHVAALRKATNAASEREVQLAEQEASLRYQMAIAEADGDKKKVAELETQLEINRRSTELEEQGVDATLARARATEEVTRLREALNAAGEKDLANARDLRDLEYQAALAASQGDQQKEKALQRELDIRRRTKDLLDLGYDAGQARTIATHQVDSLTVKEGAWSTFEEGVAEATKRGLMDAIETGDWGKALGDILTETLRDALSRAIDVLWEALAAIDWNGAGDKGTGWGGFFDMVGSSWTGRSGGGSVSRGKPYRVGELGSEWFVPNTDGFIVPNMSHGGMSGKSLGAVTPVSVGGLAVNIYGNADNAAISQIGEKLEAFGRRLPQIIDARVQDRQKRGAY
jgi:tape measure domain-containing protein